MCVPSKLGFYAGQGALHTSLAASPSSKLGLPGIQEDDGILKDS